MDIDAFLQECNSFMASYLKLALPAPVPIPQLQAPALAPPQMPAPIPRIQAPQALAAAPFRLQSPAPIPWLQAPAPDSAPASSRAFYQAVLPSPGGIIPRPPAESAARDPVSQSVTASQPLQMPVRVKEEVGAELVAARPHREAVLDLLNRYRAETSELAKLDRSELLELVKSRGQQQKKDEKLRLRVDVSASATRKLDGMWEPRHYLGSVPGVEVGDQFISRAEMRLANLHRQSQAGIDTMHHPKLGVRVATAVVTMVDEGSHAYRDDCDRGEELVYSGQGGSRVKDKEKRYAVDQQLVRGNAGLVESHKQGTLVRVIRGYRGKEAAESQFKVLYSYDGLYKVKEAKYERGVRGNMVYKFLMVRIKNQAPLVMLRRPSSMLVSSSVVLCPAPVDFAMPQDHHRQQQQQQQLVATSRSGSSPELSVVEFENGKATEPGEEDEELMNMWEVSSAGSKPGPVPLDFQDHPVGEGVGSFTQLGSGIGSGPENSVSKTIAHGDESQGERGVAAATLFERTLGVVMAMEKALKSTKAGAGAELLMNVGAGKAQAVEDPCWKAMESISSGARLPSVESRRGDDPGCVNPPAVVVESSGKDLAVTTPGKAPEPAAPPVARAPVLATPVQWKAPKLTSQGEAPEVISGIQEGSPEATSGVRGKSPENEPESRRKRVQAPEQTSARKKRSYPSFDTFIGSGNR